MKLLLKAETSCKKKLCDCYFFSSFFLQVSDQNNQSLSMTKRWFEALSPTPMDFVMSLCRQPFPETRLAGFQLMQVLATNPWGQEYIVRAPGKFGFV